MDEVELVKVRKQTDEIIRDRCARSTTAVIHARRFIDGQVRGMRHTHQQVLAFLDLMRSGYPQDHALQIAQSF